MKKNPCQIKSSILYVIFTAFVNFTCNNYLNFWHGFFCANINKNQIFFSGTQIVTYRMN